MTDQPDLEPERDPALEERFRELRNHDARRAPAFAAIVRRPKRRRWVAGGGVATALALAAAIALWIGTRSAAPTTTPVLDPRDPNLVPKITIVQLDPAPLDFLLDPPKSPSFDVVPVPEQPR